jgi:hypothetical protein
MPAAYCGFAGNPAERKATLQRTMSEVDFEKDFEPSRESLSNWLDFAFRPPPPAPPAPCSENCPPPPLFNYGAVRSPYPPPPPEPPPTAAINNVEIAEINRDEVSNFWGNRVANINSQRLLDLGLLDAKGKIRADASPGEIYGALTPEFTVDMSRSADFLGTLCNGTRRRRPPRE